MNQSEHMRDHKKWERKVRELEERIDRMKASGDNWQIFQGELERAKRQSALNYELATDRGY